MVNPPRRRGIVVSHAACLGKLANRRSGGIGRRAGFKIPSWQQGEGSSPSSGSTFPQSRMNGDPPRADLREVFRWIQIRQTGSFANGVVP